MYLLVALIAGAMAVHIEYLHIKKHAYDANGVSVIPVDCRDSHWADILYTFGAINMFLFIDKLF